MYWKAGDIFNTAILFSLKSAVYFPIYEGVGNLARMKRELWSDESMSNLSFHEIDIGELRVLSCGS